MELEDSLPFFNYSPQVSILNFMDPVHILTPYFLKIQFGIFLLGPSSLLSNEYQGLFLWG
jgi:hypothetical protein